MAKIIVLTPVKNEEWILKQYLTVTSTFADCIIIADQLSQDKSREICAQFPKVQLIHNNNEDFCEDERQTLLIETARKLFPDDKRILFGLDADELITADSLHDPSTWNYIRSLAPGTSLNFEKCDIRYGSNTCTRYPSHDLYFPLGYVDDEIKHLPDTIHSRRIPYNPEGETVYIDDIKFAHFLYSRINVRFSKLRYYAVLENLQRSSKLHIRRFAYNTHKLKKLSSPASGQPVPREWFRDWEEIQVNLTHFQEPEYTWQDYKILECFKQYGYERFHLDDIWNFNWEACLHEAKKQGKETPELPVRRPGSLTSILLKIFDQLYILSRRIRLKPIH
ncbi:glycosyltransferase family 2 protein [Pedobacter sp. AW31-3R]|uniref:glycosyltransferase family 2 protein n=1 Tax=Pedobacter sp. AW31-3R TaxID=3445781 RepID=UPI003FA14282